MRATLSQLASDLENGVTTSVQLTENYLTRIDDPLGEGARAFIKVDHKKALASAHIADQLRAANLHPSPFTGIPIAVKDLFDLKGEPTPAGSKVLANAEPATVDAAAIAKLKSAGFVIIGRNNMTEFAFSGVGINPHYGTPSNPYDREKKRIPGGSSSGAAVAVTDQMAAAAIGSDTGGSCRIPAALCGITGYKPTASSVSTQGALPLSTTLDSIGPLANSVECCASLYRLMNVAKDQPLIDLSVKGLRIGVPQSVVFEGIEPYVANVFEKSLEKLSQAGAHIIPVDLNAFHILAEINGKGGFPAPEAYAWHKELLAQHGDQYDQRVRGRLMRAHEQTASDYVEIIQMRHDYINQVMQEIAPFDVIAMPTVPIIAPQISALDDADTFTKTNLALLRNPTLINMLDGCSISLPIHEQEQAPVGLMLSAGHGRDNWLLSVARGVETELSRKQ
ncbi:amidase [Brucellaceae bacterium C25G]